MNELICDHNFSNNCAWWLMHLDLENMTDRMRSIQMRSVGNREQQEEATSRWTTLTTELEKQVDTMNALNKCAGCPFKNRSPIAMTRK